MANICKDCNNEMYEAGEEKDYRIYICPICDDKADIDNKENHKMKGGKNKK